MDTIAIGVFSAILGAITLWSRMQQTFLTRRIDKLEKAVDDCSHHRIHDAGTIARLESELAHLRELLPQIQQQLAASQINKGLPALALDKILLLVDITGAIVRVDGAVSTLLGWTPDELLGKHHAVLIPPEQRDGHDRAFRLRAMDNSVRADVSVTRRVNVLAKSGVSRMAWVSLTEQREDPEKIFRVTLTFYTGENHVG